MTKTATAPRYVLDYLDAVTLSHHGGRVWALDSEDMPARVESWLRRHAGAPTGAYMGEYLYFDVTDYVAHAS